MRRSIRGAFGGSNPTARPHFRAIWSVQKLGPVHLGAIYDYAQAVEALGYTHILVFDYVMG